MRVAAIFPNWLTSKWGAGVLNLSLKGLVAGVSNSCGYEAGVGMVSSSCGCGLSSCGLSNCGCEAGVGIGLKSCGCEAGVEVVVVVCEAGMGVVVLSCCKVDMYCARICDSVSSSADALAFLF